MADKPYTGRKAGTFVKDKATGKLTRREEQPAASATETAKPAAPAAKKGK